MHYQDSLHVACAQINVELAQVDANLERHLSFIADAVHQGVELLVFPELSLTGYGLGSQVMDVAMPVEDPRLARLAEASGRMQTVVGFVEEAGPGEYYNALALCQQGQVIDVHRKLQLPTYGGLEEGKWFTPGHELTYSDVRPGWSASHLICADLWNPGLVHAALLQRPTVLCAPINSVSGIVSESFSNERNWGINLEFYAMTYGTPVLMANRFGPEGNGHFWGGSRILGPRGETLGLLDSGEGLVSAELRRTDIAKARFELPTHRDANGFLVRSLMM